MSESSSAPVRAITLDQLLALNDELAALARAGVPLEKGLLELGTDLPRGLARVAERLGERLSRGQDLGAALAEDTGLPPAYRALVTAGIRSGRLAAALEGMASLLRRAAETRRIIVVSMIYPVVVLAVAYAALVFSLARFYPALLDAYRDFLPDSRWLNAIGWAVDTAHIWAPCFPPIVVGSLVLWWIRLRRSWRVESTGGALWRRSAAAFASLGNVLRAGRVATFAEVLALLVEHEVPLGDAVALAGDASADRRLRDSARRLAAALQRGERPAGPPGIPPVLGWLLASGASQRQLVRALRRAADSYRRWADRMVRWLSVYLPLWLTAALGGTVVVLYALSVFVPWCHLLQELSKPP